MNQKDIKKVFQGEIFSIWQWEQELYDGTTKTFERATRRDAAGIIGVLPDKKIILTWDEQPDRAGVLTPAGGGLEEGENAEQGALREFQEETGYTTSEIIPLLSYRPAHKVEFTVSFFVGKNCIKSGEPHLDAGEKIELRFFTFEEFLALGQDESLRDMRLRIMLLEAQLDPNKRKILEEKLYG
jgi:ADP-ribose pyrophosphatase